MSRRNIPLSARAGPSAIPVQCAALAPRATSNCARFESVIVHGSCARTNEDRNCAVEPLYTEWCRAMSMLAFFVGEYVIRLSNAVLRGCIYPRQDSHANYSIEMVGRHAKHHQERWVPMPSTVNQWVAIPSTVLSRRPDTLLKVCPFSHLLCLSLAGVANPFRNRRSASVAVATSISCLYLSASSEGHPRSWRICAVKVGL